MRKGAQLGAVGNAAVVALAALLALTPVCGALCQSRACDGSALAADGPCHQVRPVPQDAQRIVPTTPSCNGRDLPAAVSPSRLQPAEQLSPDRPASLPPEAAGGLEGQAAFPTDRLRRPGPAPAPWALSSLVLRI